MILKKFMRTQVLPIQTCRTLRKVFVEWTGAFRHLLSYVPVLDLVSPAPAVGWSLMGILYLNYCKFNCTQLCIVMTFGH